MDGGAGRNGGAPVVVVGAGIVGVSTALWLLREGVQVTLVDRQAPGEGTSFGNAGVLASCSFVPVTVPGLVAKAPGMLFGRDGPLFLRWGYLPRLAPFLTRYLAHCAEPQVRRIAAGLAPLLSDSLGEHEALAEGTPAARFVVPSPYRFAYRDRAAFEKDRLGWDIRREHGVRWDLLEGREARRAEPLLGPSADLLVSVPGHGHITDPGAYVKALAAHAVDRGARLVTGAVDAIARDGGRVTGVRVGGETLPARAVVVATGAWSAPLARALGLEVPLESERGYHLELLNPSAMPKAPTMIAAGKFVVTPMEGRVRLAGLVEFGGLDAPPSRAPYRLMERLVRSAMPSLSWRGTREWMGHRPATTDSLPLVGEVPGVAGAYLGFGHQHVGLTAGPRTGRLLAQLVSGKRPNVDMTPYDPVRFAAGRAPLP